MSGKDNAAKVDDSLGTNHLVVFHVFFSPETSTDSLVICHMFLSFW